MRRIYVVILWISFWVVAILIDGLTPISKDALMTFLLAEGLFVSEASAKLLHRHGIWSVIKTIQEKRAFATFFAAYLIVGGLYVDRPKFESLMICYLPATCVIPVILVPAWFGLSKVVPDYCHRVMHLSFRPQSGSGGE